MGRTDTAGRLPYGELLEFPCLIQTGRQKTHRGLYRGGHARERLCACPAFLKYAAVPERRHRERGKPAGGGEESRACGGVTLFIHLRRAGPPGEPLRRGVPSLCLRQAPYPHRKPARPSGRAIPKGGAVTGAFVPSHPLPSAPARHCRYAVPARGGARIPCPMPLCADSLQQRRRAGRRLKKSPALRLLQQRADDVL